MTPVLLLLATLLAGDTQINWDGLKLTTIEDQTISIHADGTKATVFVFVTNVCPIANAYQPRLHELQKEFGSRGIQFVQVYPVKGITKEAVATHRREFDIQAHSVLDPDRQIAHRIGAKITPEVFVVDRAGKILYRGRIDDQHAALGKKRPQATEHNLAEALKALLSNEPVAVPETKAIGCLIR